MKTIEFTLEDETATALATSKGWTPTIEDTSQELIGDAYPPKANPVTLEMFLAVVVSGFIKDYVVKESQSKEIANLASIASSIEDELTSGKHDEAYSRGETILLRVVGDFLSKVKKQ